MKHLKLLAVLCALLTIGLYAAQSPAPQGNLTRPAGVPRVLKYGGTARDHAGSPRAGTVGIRFAIYGEHQGGAPLWQETQNVQLDAQGRYSVLLGTQTEFPAGIFSNNEARWLGVQVLADAEPEQPRVLLISVPYALKAQDAETLGGRPASAYVLQEPGDIVADAPGRKSRTGGGQKAKSLDSAQVNAGSHSVNAIPKFSATDTLADSLMFEQYAQPAFDAFGSNLGYIEDVVRVGDGTGLAKRVQIAGRLVADGVDVNTSAPNSVHVVNSNSGGFALQVNAVSQSTDFTNGIFATAQSSQAIGLAGWVFEPLVPTVSGSQYTYGVWGQNQNLTGAAVFASHVYDGAGGATAPTPTGSIGVYASTAHASGIPGVFDQRAASGKIFSGRLGGTEVINMTSAGHLTAAGTVTGNAFSLPATTGINTGVITLGGMPFIHSKSGVSCCISDPAPESTFVGREAGNFSQASAFNTGIGTRALQSLTTGEINTAVGSYALASNTAGEGSTAIGAGALGGNTTGGSNTAAGIWALSENQTGHMNTAMGSFAMQSATGSDNVAVGNKSLRGNDGSANTVVGAQAMFLSTAANQNSVVGFQALTNNSLGNENAAVGYRALYDNYSGSYNIGIGSYSGSISDGSETGNFSGSYNTFLGYQARPIGIDLQNATAIGANARVGANDALVLGSSVVKVGIGTSIPAYKLDVAGVVRSSSGGFRFPDGTTQTTAATSNPGTITGVNAGPGLSGGGTSGTVALAADFTPSGGDSGTASTIARGDHLHDARYLTLTGASALAVRGINFIAGCDSCNLLQLADRQKAIYMNVVGAMTVNEVTCISDLGAPTINLQRDDGSVGNILSADLACSTGGASTTAFLDSALAVGDKIDFYVTGGTGAAHRVTVVIKATIN